MKSFLLANLIVYSTLLIGIVFSHGVYLKNLLKTLQIYLLLWFSAFFSFLNFFNYKSIENIIASILWLGLIIPLFYIRKYKDNKYYLFIWILFLYLLIGLGMFNPMFKA